MWLVRAVAVSGAQTQTCSLSAKRRKNKQKDASRSTFSLAHNDTVPADGHVIETIMGLNESEH